MRVSALGTFKNWVNQYLRPPISNATSVRPHVRQHIEGGAGGEIYLSTFLLFVTGVCVEDFFLVVLAAGEGLVDQEKSSQKMTVIAAKEVLSLTIETFL